MDSVPPFMRRESNKRSFSTMAASRRDDTPIPGLYDFQDEHYENEQSSRRRRLNSPPRVTRYRYPVDYLDSRNVPVSASTNERESSMNGRRSRPVVIDLTDEDGPRGSQQSERLSIPLRGPSGSERAAAGSSRAQRLPRWSRALVDSPSSGDEDEHHGYTRHFSERGVAPVPSLRRPQFSSLRRPAPAPSPPPDMEDEGIEFVISQATTGRQQRNPSRRSTPAVPRRSVTPYPAAQNQLIDLTQDDDDEEEVVHLNTRQRTGANEERPVPTANVGMRGLAGNIANIFREEGGNLGGRLMQRLNAYAGFDGEVRAQQQAFEHFANNHGQRHAQHHHHHHLHHHNHRPAPPSTGNYADLQMRTMNNMAPRGPMMNFELVGFDMGIAGGNRPPTPKYSPPPEAEPGFTRSPAEDEVVVCPNCGDELAMGDNEVKQEVWAIKSCGHVYCGECAQNRGKGKGKKGKGKAPTFDDPRLPQPFNKCVVEGCTASASAKSMVLVYLGS